VTTLTWWLGRATATSIIACVLVTLWTLFGDAGSPGRRQLRAYGAWLDAKLRFLRSTTSVRFIIGTQLVLAAATVGAAITFHQWPSLFLLPVVAFAPKVLLERQVARRVARVEEQIEPWVNAVANALKASPSLGEAIASTTTLVPAPMSEEIDVLIKEYELGTPLDRALDALAQRIGSQTLSGTVLALKVARRSGGNLPEMLENAASALRELARLEGVVRTKTAEGKAQALVIGIIPIPMVGGVHLMDPGFFEPLASTFVGNLIVVGAATLWAIAILLARKILAVDV
jgi:tight adherence protein B